MLNEIVELMRAEIARSEDLLQNWVSRPADEVLASYTVAFPNGSSCCGAVPRTGGAYGYHMAASRPDAVFHLDKAHHVAARWIAEHLDHDGAPPVPMRVVRYLELHIEHMRRSIRATESMMAGSDQEC